MKEGNQLELSEAEAYLQEAIKLDKANGVMNSDTLVCLGRTYEKQN